MSDNIPPEDDITKTQLWKNTDIVHDTIELINQKLQDRISFLEGSIRAGVTAQLEENKVFISNYDNTLDSKLNAFTKKIQAIILEATDNLRKENSKNIQGLEEKIRDIQASIPLTVKQQTKDYLDPTNTRLAQMRVELDTFKKSLLDTTGKMGSELTAKISDLSKRLEEVLKKFRSLSSAI